MPDLTPERRANLVRDAVHFQECAADAHITAASCMALRTFKRTTIGFQRDVSFFSRRARECLFALIGADADKFELLTFAGAAMILAEVYAALQVFA